MLDLDTLLQNVDRRWRRHPWLTALLRLTPGPTGRVRHYGVQRGPATLGLRGDHVLSVLQNRHEAATPALGLPVRGPGDDPLNWRAKPEEIDHALRDSGAWFCTAASPETVNASTLAASVVRLVAGDLLGPGPAVRAGFAEPVDPRPHGARRRPPHASPRHHRHP